MNYIQAIPKIDQSLQQCTFSYPCDVNASVLRTSVYARAKLVWWRKILQRNWRFLSLIHMVVIVAFFWSVVQQAESMVYPRFHPKVSHEGVSGNCQPRCFIQTVKVILLPLCSWEFKGEGGSSEIVKPHPLPFSLEKATAESAFFSVFQNGWMVQWKRGRSQWLQAWK